MIHLNSNLFYEICNTINEHNQRQTFITTLFLSDLNSSFITSSSSSLIMISMLSLFESLTGSSLLSLLS